MTLPGLFAAWGAGDFPRHWHREAVHSMIATRIQTSPWRTATVPGPCGAWDEAR